MLYRAVEVLRQEGYTGLLKKIWSSLGQRFTELYSSYSYDTEYPVCDLRKEDWDNLLLLDGCRFDQFQQVESRLDGHLEARISLGSGTPEFLANNFSRNVFHDTVYITANPMYQIEDYGNVFHNVIDAWKENWNETLGTVPPDDMVSTILDANQQYPEKRLLVHFIQPHYPFIGEKGRRIGNQAGIGQAVEEAQGNEAYHEYPTVWELLEDDKISEEAVWEAYDENLSLVLETVEEILPSLSGKTVLTADHGNLVNEQIVPLGKKHSGHPLGIYTDSLRKVPWYVFPYDSRKTIKSEEPQYISSDESKVVSERLSDLGYVDK